MSTGRATPQSRTLYFGPAQGIYAKEAFDSFVKDKVGNKLKEIGRQGPCNPEIHDSANVTYHFPSAGIGISYQSINPLRCMVNLIGMRAREVNDITNFLFEEDNKS